MSRRLTTELDDVLTPIGFQRTKSTWTREAPPYVDVIDLQTSKAGASVTLNAGVLDPEVYAYCWGSEPPARLETADCTVRARVGELASERRDEWWPTAGASTPEQIEQALAELLVPFMARMHSRDAMIHWLEQTRVAKRRYPPPIIYLATLRFLKGDIPEACDLLRGLHASTSGPWQGRVSDILIRLECNPDDA